MVTFLLLHESGILIVLLYEPTGLYPSGMSGGVGVALKLNG